MRSGGIDLGSLLMRPNTKADSTFTISQSTLPGFVTLAANVGLVVAIPAMCESSNILALESQGNSHRRTRTPSTVDQIAAR